MHDNLIKAQAGKVFMRRHDNFIMGNEIYLGYDYSTGVKREDKDYYYEQIDEPKTEPNIEQGEIL